MAVCLSFYVSLSSSFPFPLGHLRSLHRQIYLPDLSLRPLAHSVSCPDSQLYEESESLTLPLCFVARGDFERPEERDPQLQLTDLAKHCERSAQWDARVAEQFDVVAAALEGGSELTTRERYS